MRWLSLTSTEYFYIVGSIKHWKSQQWEINTNTNLSLLLYSSYGNFVTTFACLILARFYNSPRTVSVKVLTLPAVAAEPTLRGIKHLLHVTNSDKRCTCWFKSLHNVTALTNDFVLQARGFCKVRLFSIFLLTLKNLIL